MPYADVFGPSLEPPFTLARIILRSTMTSFWPTAGFTPDALSSDHSGIWASLDQLKAALILSFEGKCEGFFLHLSSSFLNFTKQNLPPL